MKNWLSLRKVFLQCQWRFWIILGLHNPHTVTPYVLDLTQGELQPLEEIDDETLQKMDLEAIIAQAEELTKPVSIQKVQAHQPVILNTKEMDGVFYGNDLLEKSNSASNSAVPLLLKLHPHAIPRPNPCKTIIPKIVPMEKKNVPVGWQFLPPVPDSAIDGHHFKRYILFWLLSEDFQISTGIGFLHGI